MKHYKVNADRETGEWIGEPEFVGEVSEQEWYAKRDTDEAHYDTYGYEILDETKSPITTETRGIEMIWVD